MTFTSTSVVPAGSDFRVTGDLTIKGVTKSVVLDLEFNGVHPDPWGGTRSGFSRRDRDLPQGVRCRLRDPDGRRRRRRRRQDQGHPRGRSRPAGGLTSPAALSAPIGRPDRCARPARCGTVVPAADRGGRHGHQAHEPRRALRARRRPHPPPSTETCSASPRWPRSRAARSSGRPTPPTTTTSPSSPSVTVPVRPRPAGPPSGSTTWPGRSAPLATWPRSARSLQRAGALVGASDHGVTKSFYAKDPDGLEFEVCWVVPADLLACRTSRSGPGRSTSTASSSTTAPTLPAAAELLAVP